MDKGTPSGTGGRSTKHFELATLHWPAGGQTLATVTPSHWLYSTAVRSGPTEGVLGALSLKHQLVKALKGATVKTPSLRAREPLRASLPQRHPGDKQTRTRK